MPGGEIDSEKWAEHWFDALWPGKSYEAMGRNVRPDYVVDGGIAVEVTRLTDNTESVAAALTRALNTVFVAYGVQPGKSRWEVYCECEPELLEGSLKGKTTIPELKQAASQAIEEAQSKHGELTDEYVDFHVPLCGINSSLNPTRPKSCAFRAGIRDAYGLYKSMCGCPIYLHMVKYRSGNPYLNKDRPNFRLVQVQSNTGGLVLSDTLKALRGAVTRKSSKISMEEIQKYEEWWLMMPDYVNVAAAVLVSQPEHKIIQDYLATQHPWSGFVLLNRTGWLLDGQQLGQDPFVKFAGPGKPPPKC